LAVVGKSLVRACGPKLRRRCPKRWELLQTTLDVRVRSCQQCRKPVHFCDTLDEAVDNTRHGRRVALSISVPTRDLSRYPALVGIFRRTGQARREHDDEFDIE
jgi:hypothetical protein